jgi:hypothetical protein
MNLVASARAGAQAREPIRRYIYLFLLTLDDLKGPTKLKVVKYNLEGFGRSDAWETPIELTVPAKLDLTSVVPVQTTGESDPPGLAFQDGDGLIYVLSLNLQGDNWESAPDGSSPSVDAGQVSVLKGRFSARTLVAVVNINHRRWFCWVENGPGGFLWLFAYEYFTNYDQSSERSSFLVEIDVLGVMPWSSPNNLPTQIYIFDRQTSWWSDTGVFYHKATYDLSFHPSELLQGTKHPTASDLSRVIVNSGDAPPDQRRFAYERGGAQYYCSFMESGDSLNEYTTIPAVPRVAVPLNIPARLAEPELQMRRQRIREAFDANQDAPLSALTYLDEAYYFVPMFIALQLQRCGEYTAALDWFRTVYDYSAAPDQRKIYYGLEREASLAMVYQRASNWLLDPLDPHSIAASRPNTYTRFTLLMLVRCLLDYGDDEFSRDTPESLPRARTLYTTAMDLLNTDVLQQFADTVATQEPQRMS